MATLQASVRSPLFPTFTAVSLSRKDFTFDAWNQMDRFFFGEQGKALVPKVAKVSQGEITLRMRSSADGNSIELIVREAALQFGATRLIEIFRDAGVPRWVLTVAGMARLASLRGKNRAPSPAG
jgi:hypothetical protein